MVQSFVNFSFLSSYMFHVFSFILCVCTRALPLLLINYYIIIHQYLCIYIYIYIYFDKS
jgi:hypothetical protein